MKRAFPAMIFVAILAGLSPGANALTPEEARRIFEANRNALVTIQIVVEEKMSFEGQTHKEEHKRTSTGTVVDPSGLAVSSLTEVDPSAFISEMEREGYSVEVVSAKIRTSDGTETPADVVLRDPDLDLVFIRPKKAPDKPMAFVDLSQSAAPQVLDELVVLGTLGRNVNYSVGASVDRVVAIVTKPRTFYAIGSAPAGGVAFAADGKAVGITLWRVTPTRSDYEEGDSWQPVILPCDAVAKAAQQAKTAAPVKPAESAKPVEPAAAEPGPPLE